MDIKDIFYIKENNWYKLQAWATIAHEEDKNEISGLMTAVPQDDNRFLLSDVEILKQENSSTNTELDKDAVAEYTMKYAMKYKNPNMKFVWWHSHHTMSAFWSGTDESEINAWQNNSFSLALVINLKEEYKFRVSIWNANGLPIEQHYDTTLTIERKESKIKISENMKKKYSELCSERQTGYSYTGTTTYLNGKPWKGNKNQRHLWQQPEKINGVDTHYSDALKQATSMQDSVVDGTLKINYYKKEITNFNKTCKTEKLPFIHIRFKTNSPHELLNILIQTMPEELFEWEDNEIKEQIETMEWNNSFRGYW